MIKSIDIPLLLLLSKLDDLDGYIVAEEEGTSFPFKFNEEKSFEDERRSDQFYSRFDIEHAEERFLDYEDAIRQALGINKHSYSMSNLAKIMGVSSSTIHDAVTRLSDANLLSITDTSPVSYAVYTDQLTNLIVHAIKYIAPAKPGSVSRGIPTTANSPAFKNTLSSASDMPFIWPTPLGHVTGISIEPLHKSVPFLSMLSMPSLYTEFALIDSIRIGSKREREFAIERLRERL